MPKKYLTVKEVARLLGVTPLTVRNWDARGKLTAHRHPLNNYRMYKNEDVEEYRITISVSLTLWDFAEDKAVWTESSFSGDTTYFTTGPLAKSEGTAVEDAIKDLARRIVERTVENW